MCLLRSFKPDIGFKSQDATRCLEMYSHQQLRRVQRSSEQAFGDTYKPGLLSSWEGHSLIVCCTSGRYFILSLKHKNIKAMPHYQSPQFNPRAAIFPPLTAASIASASSRSANTSSPSSGGRNWSSISGAVTPSAFCRACSRSGPRNLSIEVNSSGRFLCSERIFLIVGEVAVVPTINIAVVYNTVEFTHRWLRTERVEGSSGHLFSEDPGMQIRQEHTAILEILKGVEKHFPLVEVLQIHSQGNLTLSIL